MPISQEIANALLSAQRADFLSNNWNEPGWFKRSVDRNDNEYPNSDRFYLRYLLQEDLPSVEQLALLFCWKFYMSRTKIVYNLIWGKNSQIHELREIIALIRASEPYEGNLQLNGRVNGERVKAVVGNGPTTRAFVFHLGRPLTYYLYDKNVKGCLEKTANLQMDDLELYLEPDHNEPKSKYQMTIEKLAHRYNSSFHELNCHAKLKILRKIDRLLWKVGKDLSRAIAELTV